MSSVSSERKAELEHWKQVYSGMPVSEVRVAKLGWTPNSPGFVAADEVLQQHERANDPSRLLLTGLKEHVTSIDDRLATIEQQAKRPGWRTWSFWIAVVAGILALAALLRDYWGWSASPRHTDVSTQSPKPKRLSGISIPQTSLAPPAQTSAVPYAVGQTSIPSQPIPPK